MEFCSNEHHIFAVYLHFYDMPLNKHCAFRVRVLDQLFKDYPGGLTLEELMKRVGEKLYEFHGIPSVSMRTIQSDINLMKRDPPAGYAAPIVCSYGTGLYKYDDPNFSIHQSLNDTDVNNIRQSVALLSQFKELPHFSYLTEVLHRLEGSLQENLGKELLLVFDHEPAAKGANWVTPILQAIHSDSIIRVQYEPYNKKETTSKMLHPYFLKKYRTRWYLIGYAENTARIENLALDRIESVVPVSVGRNLSFKPNPEEYYDDFIGVTRFENEPLTDIVLKASKEIWPFIESLPLHRSQLKLSEDEKEVWLQLRIRMNKEFEASVLRYGEHLEVVAPLAARKRIAERARSLMAKYQQ